MQNERRNFSISNEYIRLQIFLRAFKYRQMYGKLNCDCSHSNKPSLLKFDRGKSFTKYQDPRKLRNKFAQELFVIWIRTRVC